jgi:hypothetical protein
MLSVIMEEKSSENDANDLKFLTMEFGSMILLIILIISLTKRKRKNPAIPAITISDSIVSTYIC